MAIFMVKCPDCGSPTELNDERDNCFCTECGRRIQKEDAELYVPDPAAEEPGEPAAEEPGEPAASEPQPVGMIDPSGPKLGAGEPPVPALTLTPDLPADDPAPDPDADGGAPAPILAEAAAASFAGATNADHLNHLIMRKPQPLDSVVFHSSDECAAYVNDLHALITEALARYSQMNHAEEATCLDFLKRAADYCDMLDTRHMRFLAGTHVEKGRTVEDFGFYPVSKDVLKDLKEARKSFVEAYNDYYRPKIAAAKEELEATRAKIRELPVGYRFYRSFCTPLMGILTAALFAVGLVPILVMEQYRFGVNVNTLITVVGGVLFIGWIALSIPWITKGRSARQLYKTADRQLMEVRTYRSKLIS